MTFPSERPWLRSYAPGVPADVDVPDEPLSAGLVRAARDFGSNPALTFFGRSTTYAALADQVAVAAGMLASRGVRHGTRVAIALPNCPQHVVAFYAVVRLGAVVVEHNPTYTEAQFAEQLTDSGAEYVVAWSKVAPVVARAARGTAVREVIAVRMGAALPALKRLALHAPLAKARELAGALDGPVPSGMLRWESLVRRARAVGSETPAPQAGDVALLQYTGGTTGVPKAAVLTHRNLLADVVMGEAWVPQLVTGAETFYGALPLFHAFGLTLCLTFAVRKAARLVLFPKFDTDAVLEAMGRTPATFLPGVAPMFQRLADAAAKRGADLSTIRIGISGAMALPASTAEAWEKATGGWIIEGYGMTETSPVVLGNPIGPGRRPGALGLPFPSTEMRVVDPDDPRRDVEPGHRGELLVRGPQVFSGYWNRPRETEACLLPDGWLRTGDIVVADETGFVRLVDRSKEIIITGGFNVYPSQVEDRLRELPSVDDVAVVGVPAGDLGERVVAAIVLATGAHIDLDEVRAWCAERMARYALPRELVVLEDLPRSQIGKVLRRVVRDQILATAPVPAMA